MELIQTIGGICGIVSTGSYTRRIGEESMEKILKTKKTLGFLAALERAKGKESNER